MEGKTAVGNGERTAGKITAGTKDNWDLEKVLGYYLNGRLLTWLNHRYYVEEAEQLQKLEKLKNEKELTQKLCAILGKRSGSWLYQYESS